MDGSVINYSVRLETRVRKEGREWVAWCLPLDVMTQATTRKKAVESLKEAVELWFESCVERGVLNEALKEAGFCPAGQGEQVPKGASVVEVVRKSAAAFRALWGLNRA